MATEQRRKRITAAYIRIYASLAEVLTSDSYEELNDFGKAMKNYQKALSFTQFLSQDGYGKMIKSGIESGISRVTENS